MGRLPGPRGPLAQARAALALQRDPFAVILELQRRYPELCQIGYPPLRFVFAFGAEANEAIISGLAAKVTWREATRFLEPIDGKTALIVSDGEEHRRRRRLVQPAFHVKRINGYLDLMNDEIDRTVGSLAVGSTVDAYQLYRRTVRRIVTRALFGDHLRDRADELGDRYEPMIRFINRPITEQVLKVPLPGTRWRRAVRARDEGDRILHAEIARRRLSGEHGEDVLGELLGARDEAGSVLTDVELRDQIASLIAAGYDTTSAAVGWAVYALLADGWWDEVAAEVRDVLGDAPLEAAAVPRLELLDRFVSEVLRLYSPAVFGGRHAREPVDLLGHHVPGGTTLVYSQFVTHRMPSLWPAPDAFRPQRWDPSSALYRELPPGAYVPFGGSSRRCIGFAFALVEIKAVIVRLVQRTALTLQGGFPGFTGIAAMAPAAGVPVRVDRVG